MARARISVTIPEEVLQAADTFAAVERRSRSWVVTEAVAAYTRPEGPEAGSVVEAPHVGLSGSWVASFEEQAHYLEWKANDPTAHRVEPFRPRLAALCTALNEQSARYLVTGSAALFLLGASRTHAGIELLVHPSNKNMRSILTALRSLGAWLAVNGLRKRIRKRTVTVFGGAVRADLFTSARSLVYKEARSRGSSVNVEGTEVPIAAIGDVVEGGLS